VKLSGVPGAGSAPTSWQTCPGTVNGSNQCEVSVSESKEAIATFNLEQHALKVTINGTGAGTVTSTPAGISCSSGTCQANFTHGASVKLTVAPGIGSDPVVWQTCPGTVNGSNQCEVTVDAAKEAVATFNLEQHALKVEKPGTGTGTVTSSPSGI